MRRLSTPGGEDHPHARFTNEEAKSIRDRAPAKTLRQLAEEEGCHHETIRRLLKKVSYR